MQSISPNDLFAMLQNSSTLQLVDVREGFEHEAGNIGGIHIPLGEILERQDLLRNDCPVVLYCEKGIRSMIAIQRLQLKGAWPNLINLSGGMQAWRLAYPEDQP